MRGALVTLRLGERCDQRLDALLAEHGLVALRPESEQDLDTLWEQAEIALLHGDPLPQCADHPRLRWIHCGHAGLDRYLPQSLFGNDRIITCAAGRSAPALAEHALFMMMQLAYDDNGLRELRRWRQWRAPPPGRRRALRGRRLGIVGMGHSGQALAQYAHALGMQVCGWRRSSRPFPPSVASGYSQAAGDDFAAFLSRCEFLVLACSLNDANRQLIGRAELLALPEGAFLINIARGGLVDQAALLAALDSGRLMGTGLDVHLPEPLPVDNPLWTHPKVVMSPHNTPRLADREERQLDLIADNLRRYRDGVPLRNQLALADVSHPPESPTLGRWSRLQQRVWNRAYRWFGRQRR